MIYVNLLNEKENAIDSARIELLNDELEYASSMYKVEPIISISHRTAFDLADIYPNTSYSIGDIGTCITNYAGYDYMTAYRGFKIFTDNAIPYGRVLIR